MTQKLIKVRYRFRSSKIIVYTVQDLVHVATTATFEFSFPCNCFVFFSDLPYSSTRFVYACHFFFTYISAIVVPLNCRSFTYVGKRCSKCNWCSYNPICNKDHNLP
ncbi:unnamed protein product [Schistosoma rodhaini]|uniref:Uncharacterized protein n=1 Tax=Schistosoma rodhaini TaxID=6188 RepID=A0AA85FQL5_9TREM|nr:unnamed protein product [Schistosoma rodhaini]